MSIEVYVVASSTLMEKLNLPILKHPKPYKLQWEHDMEPIKNGKKIVLAPLSP